MAELERILQLEDVAAREALAVYRPQRQQDPVHQSTACELLIRGGKRSGKTTCAALEFGSRVMGVPVLDPDGIPYPLKHRVSTPNDPGLYWIIGWNTQHIGQTIYQKLFKPGLFRIIRDQQTKSWRVYNSTDPEDAARYAESRPADPVIPARMIDQSTWVWEAASANVFESVRLKNGALLCSYFSSSRNAKQGDAVDGIWIDEDIQNAGHLKEWQDRLTDKNGWLMWSVWPHNKNPALIGLLERAENEAREKVIQPTIQAFQLVMTDNEYIPDANKAGALARMESDDEIARRDRGELLTDQLSMYDYNPMIHLAKKRDSALPGPKAVIERLLQENNRLPADWPRYVSIDPSHVRTAVLFGVVPPPMFRDVQMGDLLIVEDEIIARRFSAAELATEVAKRLAGVCLEAMVMDQNAGRQTHAGRDESTTDLYAREFAKLRIEARTGKSSFIPGCNQPPLRYAAVRKLLQTSQFGQARLLIVEHTTPNTQREFVKYTKKFEEVNGDMQILDQPMNPRIFDCMAALEYLVAYVDERFQVGDAYVAPENFTSPGSAAFQYIQSRMKARPVDDYIHLGPGRAA